MNDINEATRLREVIKGRVGRPRKVSVDNEELFEYQRIKKIRSTRESIKEYFRDFLPKTFSNIGFFQGNSYSNLYASYSEHKKQIVVKNIGNMKKIHLKNALLYALKNSNFDNEKALNQDFEFLSIKDILRDWESDFCKEKDLNEAMHLVFSLDEQKNDFSTKALQNSVFHTMRDYFEDYKFALIPHYHQKKPHIHVILNKNNMQTGKKLHFSSKSECRKFFYDLRENFKDNLAVLSAGTLVYENAKPKVLLDRKIAELEDFVSQKEHKREYKHSTALLFKEIVESLNRSEKNLERLNENGLKELNALPALENRNFAQLKRFSKVGNRILKNVEEIEKIKKNIDDLFVLEEKYSIYFDNKEKLKEQDKILSFFKKIDRKYLSKKVLNNLFFLENTEQKELDFSLLELNRKLLDNEFFENKKDQTLFVLNKKMKILKDCKKYLLDDNEINPNEKENFEERISELEKKIKEAIEKRYEKLKQLKLQMMQQDTITDMEKTKKAKKMAFVEKELQQINRSNNYSIKKIK
ncbi:hypothetical protein CQA57_01315 [Helicobacter anseris]|uniref:MobA/VirD2-like nuclease domain-containing protein n=1 Tax=Helicobacter anseris TaxID=375926 RepID=A0A3D8JA79_9HELI|nr:relaxase/mobilization nuclease domain-containing protein [Helicobacter anseris]RDU74379.1 hypothetical protein CQA57_01315 [Helicobacter anseris]